MVILILNLIFTICSNVVARPRCLLDCIYQIVKLSHKPLKIMPKAIINIAEMIMIYEMKFPKLQIILSD